MSTISVTQLYEQLTEGVGKETAENLCSYINGKIKEELEDQTKILATKADIDNLRLATKTDIDDLRLATKTDIESLRLAAKTDIDSLRQASKKDTTDLKLEIENVRTELKVYVAETKAEIMRWMFIFWVGQVVATFGLLLMFLKR